MKRINKQNVLIYTFLVLISIALFYYFVVGHYALDTYSIINVGYREYAINTFLKARKTAFLPIIIASRCFKNKYTHSCNHFHNIGNNDIMCDYNEN